jgi:cytochrome P450
MGDLREKPDGRSAPRRFLGVDCRRVFVKVVFLDDLVLPKGSSVALGFMRVHRDPKYWPDPLKFEPDRFLSTSSTRHPFTFIPFAGGSRNCIGPKYAMMSMKSLLAMTLRKFKFFTSYDRVEDIKLKANLILRTTNGFNVSVHLRK